MYFLLLSKTWLALFFDVLCFAIFAPSRLYVSRFCVSQFSVRGFVFRYFETVAVLCFEVLCSRFCVSRFCVRGFQRRPVEVLLRCPDNSAQDNSARTIRRWTIRRNNSSRTIRRKL